MDELVIGEKRYVSSKKAAEITGYAKDYVGQLCREGYVEAKMVGRSWYVLETSIQEHRFGGSSTHTTKKPDESNESRKADEEEEAGADKEVSQSPVLGWQRPTYAPEEPTPMPSIEARSKEPTAAQGHSGAFSNAQQESNEDVEIDTVTEEKADEALSDMQTAWKEWFEQKRGGSEDGTQDRVSEISDVMEDQSGAEEDDQKNEEKYTDVGNSRDDEEEISDKEDDSLEGFEIPIQRQKDAPIEEDMLSDDEDGSDEVQPHKAVQIPLRRMRPQEEGIIHEERIVTPSKTSRSGARSARKSRTASNRAGQSSLLSRSILVAVALLVIAIALIGSGKASVVSNPIVDYLGGTSTINK